MNIDNANNIAYVDGKAYRLVPIEQEKIFICEIDGKKYYLGPEANKKMSWEQAKKWAEDMGGILIPREVAIVAFEKKWVRKHFRIDDRYWTSTEYDSNLAWIQSFGTGGQYPNSKHFAYYARAVFVE